MKKYDTLVLNKVYIPINIIDYKRCMSYLIQDNIAALDCDFIPYNFKDWVVYSQTPKVLDDGYCFVNTIKYKIAIPDIVVLKTYDRLPRHEVKYTRQTLFQRDNFICQYCGKRFKEQELTVDHVHPKSLGGGSNWGNTVTSCKACNNLKGNQTLDQAKMRLLSKPKEPLWVNSLSKLRKQPKIRSNWNKFLKTIGAS